VGSNGISNIMKSQKKGTCGFGVPHKKAFDAAAVCDRNLGLISRWQDIGSSTVGKVVEDGCYS